MDDNLLHVAFGEYTLSIRSHADEGELRRLLARCEAGSIVLGTEVQQKAEFFSAVTYLSHHEGRRFGIGLLSEGHGIPPQILLLEGTSRVVLGLNQEVIGVDVLEGVALFSHRLDGLYYAFLNLMTRNTVLVFHELGVLAMTSRGDLLWRYDAPDVLSNWFVHDGTLHLTFMDATSASLEI